MSTNNDQSTYHIPFQMQIEVNPTRTKGKRREIYIWVEKWHKTFRNILQENDVLFSLGIAKEFAFVPQVGQYPAKINVTGFMKQNYFIDSFRNTDKQTDDIHRVSVGPDVGEKTTIFTGNVGNSTSKGGFVTSNWNELVKTFIDWLINLVSGTSIAIERKDILKLRVGEVTFGKNFWTIPR